MLMVIHNWLNPGLREYVFICHVLLTYEKKPTLKQNHGH